MGCDIHSVAQVRLAPGNWKTVLRRVAGDDRNYDTFALLANVRNRDGLPSLAESRGLPDDFETEEGNCETHICPAGIPSGYDYSYLNDKAEEGRRKQRDEAEADADMGDHSHSYAHADELKEFQEKTGKKFRWHNLGDIVEVLEAIAEVHKVPLNDVRYVFGFDN